MKNLIQKLLAPVEIMPLVGFRVALGGIILWEVWRYFHFDRISRYYITPDFHFSYTGFHWLAPLPGDAMLWLFHGLGLLSFCILIGLAYRVVMPLFWVLFTYVFLLDQAQYLNHFYLISLVSFLMIFVPAHRAWSVDALIRPSLRSQTAPNWSLWLLRGQMAIVYIYGGIAKLNPDWLRGEPMRDWLSTRTDFPLIGSLFTQEWMVFTFAYGGLLFDLLIVPLILWKRTRWLAIVLALGFHLTNARLFNIGVFPYFAIAMTLLFLPAGWFCFWQERKPPAPKAPVLSWSMMGLLVGFGLYFAVQILLPLRHLAYPGYVSWTEEGHTLAWHMKLRSKDGDIAFYASDPAQGLTRRIPLEAYLSSRQEDQMKDQPEMILQFAHHLTTLETYANAEIYVWSMMSLNERASQLLIDPTVNLAAQTDGWQPAEWILPLVQPPAPADGSPAVLLSGRNDGDLLIVNITMQPFPLDGLHLTNGDLSLRNDDLPVRSLAPDGCLIATTMPSQTGGFPICNEAGDRIVLPAGWQAGHDMRDWMVRAPYALTCRPLYCILTHASPAT